MKSLLTTTLLIIFCLSQSLIDCRKASAVSTKFWNQTKHEDFISGNAVNAALYNSGCIKLAPKTENISGINASYVWCMASDQYGNVYAGTGNPGVVYKITRQKSAIEIFRSPEGLHIHSMAIDRHGNIYVGTSPDGTIYKINNEKEISLFRSLPELYIWDLVVDNRENLFAATGDMGKIYKISENGEMDVILDSKATHILDLEMDKDNNIFACSEPFGLIYKITSQGKTSVFYDAEEEEVHCLTLGNNGILYAGTASGGESHIPTPQGQMSKLAAALLTKSSNTILKEQKIPWTDFGLVDVPVDAENDKDLNAEDVKEKKHLPDMGIFFPVDHLPKKSNTVYKILPNGNAERILELDRAFIFSLVFNGTGDIYVGSGNKANIYQIGLVPSGQEMAGAHCHTILQNIATLFHVKSSQVLSLLATDNNEFYVGTGNSGSVFKVSNEFSTSGIYESSVHDALVSSKWGRLSWNNSIEKGTTINLFTRTGNSEKPDSTWSNWDAPREIELLEVALLEVELFDDLESSSKECGGIIQSPQARFIQYRAELSTINNHVTPTLKNVSISYLPENQYPKILSVEVKESVNSQSIPLNVSKTDDIKTRSSKTIQNNKLENNPQKKVTNKLIRWDAEDPDNDELMFNICFKKVNEINWCQIAKDIRGQHSFTWETNNIEDGKYLIKVLASDLLSNPKEKEQQFTMTSRPFSVDNTKPQITNIEVATTEEGNYMVTGTVSDNMSNVSSMRYAVNTGDWSAIFPTDQLFDYRNEDFRFTIPKLSKREHTVTINATDSENNTGSTKISVGVE